MKSLKMKAHQFGFTLVSKARPGFTLVELLVVISIIAILAGFGTARYLTAEKQTRDTRRKSDLSQYRIALENYASAKNTLYPNPTCGNVTNLCAFGAAPNFQTTYLSGECLQDPRVSGTVYYHYCSNGSQYAIWSILESGGYYEICSNGRSGKMSTQPVDTGGACSLP